MTLAEFAPAVTFEEATIGDLARLSPADLDALPFGVVGMTPSGVVELYNATESRIAGLRPERVIGRPMFAEIARCMNNEFVARRFETETEIDATLPYVLTLRMKAIPVRLRLLASASERRRYLLVQR